MTAARFVDNRKRKEYDNFYANIKTFYSLNTISAVFTYMYLFCQRAQNQPWADHAAFLHYFKIICHPRRTKSEIYCDSELSF